MMTERSDVTVNDLDTIEAGDEEPVVERLLGQLDQAQGLAARADAKAQSQVSVHGVAMAGAVALVRTAPASAWLVVAAVAVTAALITTLLAMLPRLRRTTTGITAWCAMNPSAITAAARDDSQHRAANLAEQIGRVSRIAVRKMRLLQVATWLIITGLAAAGIGLMLL